MKGYLITTHTSTLSNTHDFDIVNRKNNIKQNRGTTVQVCIKIKIKYEQF